jgi:peptidoglycan/LPS O-acetylase OafA/YrhL
MTAAMVAEFMHRSDVLPFPPVSSLLCNRKHSAQSWSWLELSISRRHAPFLSRPWLIARSKLSFPVYLVHWPILFGPAAALFLRLNGMAGIEVARVCAIIAGISLAFVCSMVFRSVDGGALELARALRKSMSSPSEQTARMAPVRAMAAK